MRVSKKIAVFVFLILAALQLAAQKESTLKQVNKRINASQQSFSKILGKYPIDKNGKIILNELVTTDIDKLQKIIKDDSRMPLSQKLIALNCQNYLLDTLQSQIANRTFDVNLIRDNRDNFIPLWQTIITQNSCEDIMRPYGAKTAGLMAAVFKDYPQATRIRDIATLKELERTPELIMQFLNRNSGFSLRDSLVFICANTEPERFLSFVSSTKDEDLLKVIRNNPSQLVQTLLSIAGEKNLIIYLPFAVQLSEKKLTLEEIDKARTQPSVFFKLLVDAEIANREKSLTGTTPLYLVPTKTYLKKYAIKFYTDVINSLHEEPTEKARYYVLDDLRPQDLYYVITNGETELYTSSYLYTYKRLMVSFEKKSSDSLFRLVKYDQYRKFLLMAGRYNTLSAFMQQMTADSSVSIMKRLVHNLERNDRFGMEETINVAETFPGIVKDKALSALTFQEINNNQVRCQNIPNLYGMKVYAILAEIFNAVKSGELENGKSLPPALAVYFRIPNASLREKNGNITQLVLFYGDDDGKSSYASFLSNFNDASQWSVEKNSSWVTIRSKKLSPVSIYANLPLSNEEGLDIKAQDLLAAYLTKEGISPHILIHRGHSYHLSNSIKLVTANTKLAILGSCGAYREIFEILEKSRDAQVISTKQIGSMRVNEPILNAINLQLLNGKDLDWSVLWDQLELQFKPNKQLYDYFHEYVPPYKNIALLVASLYTQADLQ